MKYEAICGNTSRMISGCKTPEEALSYAITVYDDCLDHTDTIDIYDMDGNFLISEK